MPRRHPAIFLLSLLLVNAAFGGSRGVLSICLGGGHEHGACASMVVADALAASSSTSSTCGAECSHQSSLPLPVPASDHDADCGCTDLEVELTDVPAPPRSASIDLPDADALDLTPLVPVAVHIVADPVRGPPDTLRGQPPGLAPQRTALRTVRLLI